MLPPELDESALAETCRNSKVGLGGRQVSEIGHDVTESWSTQSPISPVPEATDRRVETLRPTPPPQRLGGLKRELRSSSWKETIGLPLSSRSAQCEISGGNLTHGNHG